MPDDSNAAVEPAALAGRVRSALESGDLDAIKDLLDPGARWARRRQSRYPHRHPCRRTPPKSPATQKRLERHRGRVPSGGARCSAVPIRNLALMNPPRSWRFDVRPQSRAARPLPASAGS